MNLFEHSRVEYKAALCFLFKRESNECDLSSPGSPTLGLRVT